MAREAHGLANRGAGEERNGDFPGEDGKRYIRTILMKSRVGDCTVPSRPLSLRADDCMAREAHGLANRGAGEERNGDFPRRGWERYIRTILMK